MSQADYGGLVESIYDAALRPSRWPDVIERFSDAVGGSSAWIANLDVRTGNGTGVIARIDPLMPALYQSRFAAVNIYAQARSVSHYDRRFPDAVFTDDACVSKADMVRSEFYRGFMQPQDVYSVLTVRMATEGDSIVSMKINRPEAKGAFRDEEKRAAAEIAGHLARAYALSRKFAGLRGIDADLVAFVERMGRGILVVEASSAVSYANPAAEALLGAASGLRMIYGRLSADDPAVARELHAKVSAACAPTDGPRRGGSISLRAPGRRLPLAVTVSPLAEDAEAVFTGSRRALVCIDDPQAAGREGEARLAAMLGLTSAEARVARVVGGGCAPRQAAAELGVSYNTVRAQLSSIFAKTGVRRQAELAALVARAL